MSEPIFPMRHRRRQRTVLNLAKVSQPVGQPVGLATAAAGGAPQLGMPDPESSRSAWLSGSLSLALHGGVIGGLALFAWLNPDVIEQIIPVQIVRELPGSNEEPAPARPKALVPRRAAVAQRASPRRLTQAARPASVAVSSQVIQMADVDLKAAPTELDRRTVTAQRVAVAPTVTAPRVQVSPTALAAPVAVQATTARAPTVLPTRPTVVPTVTTTEAVPRLVDTAQPTTAAVQSAAGLSDAQIADGPAGISISTGLSEELLTAGGGTGGTGKAVGVVRCEESLFVQRYYELMRARTQDRWEVPENTPRNASVILTFRLDDSGSASDVASVKSNLPALGASAARALRAASPFPALDANTRCIAGRELRATFRVPDA